MNRFALEFAPASTDSSSYFSAAAVTLVFMAKNTQREKGVQKEEEKKHKQNLINKTNLCSCAVDGALKVFSSETSFATQIHTYTCIKNHLNSNASKSSERE